MTQRLYATPIQAAQDAQRLPDGPAPLVPLLLHLRGILGNPGANSDTLLIIADALRHEAASATTTIPTYAQHLAEWSRLIATVAPTRADVVEAAESAPPSPDFRARTLHLLDTSRDDDTVVVAVSIPDGGLLMQTSSPTPHGLIAIARALLSQARGELDQDDICGGDLRLLEAVEEALDALPRDHAA